jgi:hypothetical protein
VSPEAVLKQYAEAGVELTSFQRLWVIAQGPDDSKRTRAARSVIMKRLKRRLQK